MHDDHIRIQAKLRQLESPYFGGGPRMQVGIASEPCVEYWRVEKLTLRKSELVLPTFQNIMLVGTGRCGIDDAVDRYECIRRRDGDQREVHRTQEDWHVPLSPVATY